MLSEDVRIVNNNNLVFLKDIKRLKTISYIVMLVLTRMTISKRFEAKVILYLIIQE